jgi:site-specific recombinase XerD
MTFKAFIDSNEGKKLMDKFLVKYKSSSRKVCLSDILQFAKSSESEVFQLSETDIINYRNRLVSQVSSKSLTRKISILNKFFSFLENQLDGFINPISKGYGSQTKYQVDYIHSERYQIDLDKWLNSLHLTLATQQAYRINFNMFCKWFSRPYKDISADTMLEYRDYLKSKGYEDSTIWLKFVAINSFFKYQFGVEKALKILSFKKLGLVPPKKDKGYYQVLNEDEIKRLLKQPDKSMFGLRNSAILWLMSTYALRVNEISKLTYGDFEGERVKGQQKLWIKDRKGKAGQRANTAIILSGNALKSMDDWLNVVREKIEISDDTPIFNQFIWNMSDECLELHKSRIKDKKTLSIRAIQNVIEKYVDTAKIKRKFKVTPHALRHSALTLLAKAGVELVDLKYLAGHQDISTTMIYIHSVQSYNDHVGLHHPLNN